MRKALVLVALSLLIVGCKVAGDSDLEQQLAAQDPGAPGDDNPTLPGCETVSSQPRFSGDARDYYEQNVLPIMQSDCMACHVGGGDAGDTGFVLGKSADADYERVVELSERELAGQPYLLAKATGLAGHTGGMRFSLSSVEAAALTEFAELLTGNPAPAPGDPVDCNDEDRNRDGGESGFLDGVSLLSAQETLHKAAMLMLGRRATADELAAVADGTPAALRSTLRGMMQGRDFTRFLMTAANDQLLTNRFAPGTPLISEASEVSYYRFDEIDWPGIMPTPHYSVDDFYNEDLAAEPLALIAYIVNNERDYREVLQADYTVFNSRTYEFFDYSRDGYVQLIDPDTGAPVPPPQSPDEWVAGRFAPGVGTGYFIDRDGTTRYPETIPYPHAGVLTTVPWLARWPNTNTNGQRKRAKKVLSQFLGYDIELTANRPMNADALNDPDNPTFRNPSCTACHYQLDALAGTFQNWGYTGRFRLNQPFLRDINPRNDALNAGYKNQTTADCGRPLGEGGYCDGDLWYADRFPAGFLFQGNSDITEMPNDGPGRNGPYDNASLRWLAAQLVADPRFPSGTVKFWYEAVFNEKPLNPPIEGDPNYDAKFRAYLAQQELIDATAAVFVQDNGYGAYNLKDLLAALFSSEWFRAGAIDDPAGRHVELANVGMGALLTPEQLERKIESTLGVRWKVHDEYLNLRDAFTYTFNVMYGGIDSDTVNTRTRQVNPLMVSVIKRMVSEMACEAVYRDFIDDWAGENYQDPMLLRPAGERRLFRDYAGEGSEDEAAIKKVLVHLHNQLWNDGASPDSAEVQYSYELFRQFWEYEQNENSESMRCESNNYLEVVPHNADTGQPAYPAAAMRTWRDMLVYFMSDAQFLHE